MTVGANLLAPMRIQILMRAIVEQCGIGFDIVLFEWAFLILFVVMLKAQMCFVLALAINKSSECQCIDFFRSRR